jgi:Flp pilus assembly protein TadD
MVDIPYKKVHGLMVGISKYAEITSLDYADNDAQLMSKIIGTSFSGQEGTIITLTNENATEFSILSAITKIRRDAQDGDLVVIYLAGHGDVAEGISGANEGYFLAHNASASREYELGGSVAFERIIKFIDGLTARNIKVWLITDACRSGKIIDAKGASSTLTALINGYQNTTKFISCQANELSYEYDSLAHGVFTYYFAKGISGEADTEEVDGIISVEELNRYLTSKVRSVTNKQQTPNIHAADKYAEILAVNPEFKNMLANVNKDLAYADTGKKRGDDELTKTKEVIAFEDAVLDGKLYGSSKSAYELFLANKKTASKQDLQFMEELLINALLQRVQFITNIFLNGRPTIGKNEDFKTAVNDLDYALKLLPSDHPLRENLQNRKQFFSCLESIRKLDITSFDSVEQELKRIEKAEPNAAYIHQGLAMLYIAKNDLKKAEEQLNKAATKINTWSKPQNSLSQIDIITGNLKEAEHRIAAGEKLSNNKENALYLKAQLYQANYQLQLAEVALKDMAAVNYSESELKLLEARTNELRGRIKLAQEQYLESLSKDKNNIELMLKLAELYKTNGDTTLAIGYYSKVWELDKKQTVAKANLDVLQGIASNFNWRGVNLNDANQVMNAAQLLEDEKKYSEAIELLTAASSILTWNLEISFELGKQQYNAGDTRGSIETLKKVLEKSPYHFKSIRALALIYLHQKNNREAEALIQKHMPYFENSSKYLALSYSVYRQTGSQRDLYVILEKAIKLDSLDTEPYRGLYQLHISNSLYGEAHREFKNLIRIGGSARDSIDFYSRLESQVKLMLVKKMYEGQKPAIELLLQLDPFNFEMVYWMAFLQYMEGDYDGASKSLRVFSKDIQAFSPAVQRQFYHLRAKVTLEMGDAALAERLFGMSSSASLPPDYLGLAMAQFEQGNAKWIENFRRGGEIEDFCPAAKKRYEKMMKRAQKMKAAPTGGARQNRQ